MPPTPILLPSEFNILICENFLKYQLGVDFRQKGIEPYTTRVKMSYEGELREYRQKESVIITIFQSDKVNNTKLRTSGLEKPPELRF